MLGFWVRIPPGAWMFVCCECCVLSGRILFHELITRPEDSYRLYESEFDGGASIMSRPWPSRGCCAMGINNIKWETKFHTKQTVTFPFVLILRFYVEHHRVKRWQTLHTSNVITFYSFLVSGFINVVPKCLKPCTYISPICNMLITFIP